VRLDIVKNLKPTNRLKGVIHMMWSVTFILLITWGIPPQSYSSGGGVSQTEATQLIRQAADATEQAWEEFHDAAIQGTLASPLVQVTIESQLHEVRRLLMEARKAKRAQDYHSVKKLTQQVQKITQNIIQESRERKP
jgi:hypothetical protein